MTNVVQHIDEIPVEGKPLGRHVNHDPRSRLYAYTAPEGAVLQSVVHARTIPILDQGKLGSCTGNAAVGSLGSEPNFITLPSEHPVLDETLAIKIYSAAEIIDGGAGYPPEDNGSTGLSVASALRTMGLISGYQHTFTLNDALIALQTYNVIIGINWYAGFDTPDANGFVSISGIVRGGHEVELVAIDVSAKTVTAANSWGTSYGKDGYFTFSWDDLTRLLSEQGDVTVLLPMNVPAPVPTPIPVPTPSPIPDPVPVPPVPVPAPTYNDAVFAVALHRWLDGKNRWFYKSIQKAALVWLKAKGL